MPEVTTTLRLPNYSSNPASPVKGQIYCNTTDNTLYYYNGTAWTALATGSGAAGVSSWNTRTGAVMPATNDYNFTQLFGTASNAQLPGTISSKIFDTTNTFDVRDGTNFEIRSTGDTNKIAIFDLANIATGNTRTINVPNANSTTAQADLGTANQFLTGMSAQGVFSKAQPAFTNLSGSATTTQAGVLSGGTVGQAYIKNSSTNYDTAWKSMLLKAMAPTNPTGTTSTGGVMMGLGAQATPCNFSLTAPTSGRVLIIAQGNVANNTAGAAVGVQGRYGTGSAPANGAAAAGTVWASTQTSNVTAANASEAFCIVGILTGLSAATTYWIDLLAAVSSGTGTLNTINVNVIEIP